MVSLGRAVGLRQLISQHRGAARHEWLPWEREPCGAQEMRWDAAFFDHQPLINARLPPRPLLHSILCLLPAGSAPGAPRPSTFRRRADASAACTRCIARYKSREPVVDSFAFSNAPWPPLPQYNSNVLIVLRFDKVWKTPSRCGCQVQSGEYVPRWCVGCFKQAFVCSPNNSQQMALRNLYYEIVRQLSSRLSKT